MDATLRSRFRDVVRALRCGQFARGLRLPATPKVSRECRHLYETGRCAGAAAGSETFRGPGPSPISGGRQRRSRSVALRAWHSEAAPPPSIQVTTVPNAFNPSRERLSLTTVIAFAQAHRNGLEQIHVREYPARPSL
jgi:hypothetical protein